MKRNAPIKLFCTAAIITFASSAVAEHQSYNSQNNYLHTQDRKNRIKQKKISAAKLIALYKEDPEEQTIQPKFRSANQTNSPVAHLMNVYERALKKPFVKKKILIGKKVQVEKEIQSEKRIEKNQTLQKKNIEQKNSSAAKLITLYKKDSKTQTTQPELKYDDSTNYPITHLMNVYGQTLEEPSAKKKILTEKKVQIEKEIQTKKEIQVEKKIEKNQTYPQESAHQKYQNYTEIQKHKMEQKLYMCVDLGYTFSSKKIDSKNYNDTLKGTMLTTAGFGYKATDTFRSDILATYRGQYKYFGHNNNNKWERQNFSNITVMINGYYSPRSFDYFTPYLMAGVGLSVNKAGDFVAEAGKIRIIGTQQNNLAWQLGIGVLVEITKHANLNLEYKYVDLGHVTTKGIFGRDSCYGGTSAFKGKFSVHEISIGINYGF